MDGWDDRPRVVVGVAQGDIAALAVFSPQFNIQCPPSSLRPPILFFSLRTLTSSSLVHRSNSCHVSPLPSCPQFYLHPRRNNTGSAESQQTPHGDFGPSHFSGSHRPRKCSFGTLILLFWNTDTAIFFISSHRNFRPFAGIVGPPTCRHALPTCLLNMATPTALNPIRRSIASGSPT